MNTELYKHLKAQLKKLAFALNSWIDPNEKEYPVTEEEGHTNWLYSHSELLKTFDITLTKEDSKIDTDIMFNAGWIRKARGTFTAKNWDSAFQDAVSTYMWDAQTKMVGVAKSDNTTAYKVITNEELETNSLEDLLNGMTLPSSVAVIEEPKVKAKYLGDRKEAIKNVDKFSSNEDFSNMIIRSDDITRDKFKELTATSGDLEGSDKFGHSQADEVAWAYGGNNYYVWDLSISNFQP